MFYEEDKTIDKQALQDFADDWRIILKDTANEMTEMMLSDLIEEFLPPKTMNDIVWEGEVHHLMEANHSVCGKVVMVCEDFIDDSFIYCVDGRGITYNTRKRMLTPTGNKFKLYPDVAGETPQVKSLYSLEDYQNAGVGTLVRVENDGLIIFEKRGKNHWRDYRGTRFTDEDMSLVACEVLSGVEQ